MRHRIIDHIYCPTVECQWTNYCVLICFDRSNERMSEVNHYIVGMGSKGFLVTELRQICSHLAAIKAIYEIPRQISIGKILNFHLKTLEPLVDPVWFCICQTYACVLHCLRFWYYSGYIFGVF